MKYAGYVENFYLGRLLSFFNKVGIPYQFDSRDHQGCFVIVDFFDLRKTQRIFQSTSFIAIRDTTHNYFISDSALEYCIVPEWFEIDVGAGFTLVFCREHK